METIWKYELETVDRQSVFMPKNAKILTIQTQLEVPVLWAKVNPDNAKEPRIIIIHGTGHRITKDVNYNYLGTYQLMGGKFIGHVFEEII